jgi:hypothetical protein
MNSNFGIPPPNILSNVASVPFVGMCNVKLIKADIYIGSVRSWFTLRSNTLLKPPYISKIILTNNNNRQALNPNNGIIGTNWFGNFFKFENIFINGYIDFTIAFNDNETITSSSAGAIIWLDIEYVNN